MININEYQAKQLFTKYKIPVPNGYTCSTISEIDESITKIGPGPWIIKCQIPFGERARYGGVKIFQSKIEILNFAKKWFQNRLITCQTGKLGEKVNKILIEKVVNNIKREIYVGITIDRNKQKIIFIVSPNGGRKINYVNKFNKKLIYKTNLDPLIGPQLYQGREIAFKLGLSGNQILRFNNIFISLSNLFIKYDLILAEINPIAITENNNFVCLDGKIIADENSLFRQLTLQKMHNCNQKNEDEIFLIKKKLNYISLNGNIGTIVNGAGLAMSTIDLIKIYGGKPANFLDIGSKNTKKKIIDALKLMLLNKEIKVIFINIFGGIVQCDLVVEAILKVTSVIKINIPIFLRLEGNNSKIAIKKLNGIHKKFFLEKNLIHAIKKVICISNNRKF